MSSTDATHAPIPGQGLSYADLSACASDSPERETWHALSTLCDILGVPDHRPLRSATIDEMVADIRATLNEDIDIAAAAKAAQDLAPELPRHKTRHQVRRLIEVEVRGSNGPPVMSFVPLRMMDTIEEALDYKAQYLTDYPNHILTILRVQTTTSIEIIPEDAQTRR